MYELKEDEDIQPFKHPSVVIYPDHGLAKKMLKSKKILFIPFIFCLFLFFHTSCKKEEIKKIIKVTTDEVTQITTNSATVNGTIVDIGEGITEHGFCWSTTINPTIELTTKTQLGSTNSKGSFTSNLTNLIPNTTYYIRSYGGDSETIKYGNEKSFLTESETLASITTGTISEITDSSAIVTGALSDLGNGIDSILQHGFCWSTNQNPTIENDKTELGSKSSTGEFISNLTGLSPGTIYYVRAYATNSIGIAYGNEINFTTSAILPTITTTSVTDITYNSATSGGDITDDGGASVTARGVCWSTLQNPTISDNYTTDGSGSSNFLSTITGLSGDTTYYVRAYATNSIGTAYGNQIEFTTTEPVLPTVTTISVRSITENSAIGGGNITDDGGATVTARGICWSFSSNPTTADSKTTNGNGTGSFTSSLTGLSSETTYHIRAYAINSVGTSYGNEETFTNNVGGSEGTFTDFRDEHQYNWIKIGNQGWMAENLAYLPSVSASSAGSYTDPYYYVYDYQGNSLNEAKATSKYATYGVLYNWTAAMAGASSSSTNPSSVQGVCPDGWHVPSDAEWKELEMFLGMSQSEADESGDYRGTDEGRKLKETGTTHWLSPTGATNESGFTALPGGLRASGGYFYAIGNTGRWWSSTGYDTYNTWYRIVSTSSHGVWRGNFYKDRGHSIRCIRDD